jgi:D-threonine aldolase
MPSPWYSISNLDEVSSPALLVYPDRVAENTRRMIAMAGGVERLRPHVKTHKMAEVIRMQMEMGISKFKCSTIAEAEMVASCGAADILLAYQPVGPNIPRMVKLTAAFPQTKFSASVDDAATVRALSAAFAPTGRKLSLLIDIDNGQHRTGVPPGNAAVELYRLIADSPGLELGGLHVYDGHIKELDPALRRQQADEAFAPVAALRKQLEAAGLPVPRVVAGGTPTFPAHAKRPDVECSPGTCVFWDCGYGSKFLDLDFLHAALLLTRVVSKPGPGRICLDLGYKAVSPDNPQTRVQLLELPDAKVLVHNEEHLALESSGADRYHVGDALFGVPFHVCPTCALHQDAVIIENGRATTRWKVLARDRLLSI